MFPLCSTWRKLLHCLIRSSPLSLTRWRGQLLSSCRRQTIAQRTQESLPKDVQKLNQEENFVLTFALSFFNLEDTKEERWYFVRWCIDSSWVNGRSIQGGSHPEAWQVAFCLAVVCLWKAAGYSVLWCLVFIIGPVGGHILCPFKLNLPSWVLIYSLRSPAICYTYHLSRHFLVSPSLWNKI